MSAVAIEQMVVAAPLLDDWPVPDFSLLKDEGISPPAFDSDALPEVLGTWCRSMAAAKACPVDFIALNLLIAASTWLGNARRVAASGDWVEPPHIWGAIISPPSGGKTPSQQPFIEVSKVLEVEAEPEWQDRYADYEKRAAYAAQKSLNWDNAVAAAAKNDAPIPDFPDDAKKPQPPARPRLILCDATTQEIINILAGNPKGLLIVRDELSGWIGSFDRYSGTGADRGFYLESWNGGRYSVDLVKHSGNPVLVPYTSLAILGGIQPDKLREALAGSDDGFAARFCYVWPNLVPYAPLVCEPAGASEARIQFLLNTARRLRGLQMGTGLNGSPIPRVLPLSLEALALFENIRREAIEKARGTKGLVAGWHGKTPARALRFALVIELLMWAAAPAALEPMEVSAAAMAHAGTYLDYLSAMFEKVVNGLVMDEAETDAAAVMKFIVEHRSGMLNERELYQKAGFAHLRKAVRRKAAFQVLERDGWVRQPQAAGRGRRRSDWMANPHLWESAL